MVHQTNVGNGPADFRCGLRPSGGSALEQGFTLMELLTVVTIIGVLAALLSTAFNNTKAQGRKVSCLNNLHHMQIALRLYIDDNDDWLPLNRSVDGPLEQFFGRPNSSNSWVCGTPKADSTAV